MPFGVELGRITMSTAGSIRIIAGRWRGTKLTVPDLPGLRPTSDRVRETLFNWLQPMLHGARVLDLFAGSGALGLEAVSRGAREAILVEHDPKLAESLRRQIERLQAQQTVRVVCADVLRWLQAPLQGCFDLVFIDPPFQQRLWPRVLAQLDPWLDSQPWLYLEMPATDRFNPEAPWQLHREGTTREVRYALYRRLTHGPDPSSH